MRERPAHIPEDYLQLTLPVVKEFAGWRADRFVAHKIPRLSRNRVQRILRRFAFDQEGRPLKPNRILREGEVVIVYKRPPDEPEVTRDYAVVYEDPWLLAVDKPPRLPVHPTARYLHNTLTALLAERHQGDGPPPTLVHRLDAETSGIVLCAKTKEAERRAKRLFLDRRVHKTYVAVVRGVPAERRGRIEAPIALDPRSEVSVRVWCGDPNGWNALTEYTVVADSGDRSLLVLHPRTGRQHQLRIHLAHLGHPIVGDKLYGPDQSLFLDYMAQGLTDDIVRRAGHERQLLHAAALRLEHPITGAPLCITCPPPADFSPFFPDAASLVAPHLQPNRPGGSS